MFAFGGRLSRRESWDSVYDRVDLMVHSPWEWWTRAHAYPVVDVQARSSLRRFEAQEGGFPIPLKTLEEWCQFYLDRELYRQGWALLSLLFFGEQRLGHPSMFQWQGFPHRSRIWIFDDRRSVLLPAPIGGPVVRLLDLWFSLSGGLHANVVLKPDFGGFLRGWSSLSAGPYHLHPLADLTPERALEEVRGAFSDLRGFTTITSDLLLTPPPNAERRGDLMYVDQAPLCRSFYSRATVPDDSPWGMGWLKTLEGTLPQDLLLEAEDARRCGMRHKREPRNGARRARNRLVDNLPSRTE